MVVVITEKPNQGGKEMNKENMIERGIIAIAVIAAIAFVISLAKAQMELPERDEKAGIERIEGGKVTPYIDPQTGVNYLIFIDEKKAGMTVRYNEDGTVFVSKTEGE